MIIYYENYKGGINNLIIIESGGIRTTSTKSKDAAIKNHNRKLKKYGDIL